MFLSRGFFTQCLPSDKHMRRLYETVWAGEAGSHYTGPLHNGSRCMTVQIHSFEVRRLIVHLAADLGALTYSEKWISI